MWANNDPGRIEGSIIPRENILVNGHPACALIYSGCTQTLVGPTIQTGDGRIMTCESKIPVVLPLAEKTIEVLCVVTKKMVLAVDIIVETDVLKHFKFSLNCGPFSTAVAVNSSEATRECLTIFGNNFEVIFDGEN